MTLNQLVETEKLVERTGECWAEAEMFRLRGTLLLSMNEHAQAENHVPFHALLRSIG